MICQRQSAREISSLCGITKGSACLGVVKRSQRNYYSYPRHHYSIDSQCALCAGLATLSQCDVTLQETNWTVTGSCHFEHAFSYIRGLSCTWYMSSSGKVQILHPLCLPVCLPACLSVGLFAGLSVCLSVCLSVWFTLLHMNENRMLKQSYDMQIDMDMYGKCCWASRLRDLLRKFDFVFVRLRKSVGMKGVLGQLSRNDSLMILTKSGLRY